MKPLTEERNRMLKLINFSYDDNSADVLAEENVLEQSRNRRMSNSKGNWRFALKFWPGAKGFGSGGLRIRFSKGKYIQTKKGGNLSVDQETEGKIVTDPIDDNVTGWKNFLKENEKPMVKKMSSGSKRNWEKLKNDPEHIAYAVYSLEQFLNSNKKNKWEIVAVNSEEGVKEEIEEYEVPVEPNEPNALEIILDLPLEGGSSNFFADNQWQPTQEFKDKLVEDVLVPLNKLKSKMTKSNPEGKPYFFLADMTILTSCSRFRNSGAAKDLTFLELSENRNNAAKQYVENALKNIGVLIDGDTKISQNAAGENGDGSSGPNTPDGNMIATDGKYNTASNDASLRDKYGAPHADKKLYDQYKYCEIELAVQANLDLIEEPGGGQMEPTIETRTVEIPTTDYDINFITQPKGRRRIKWNLDWVKKTRKRRRGKSKRKKFKTLLCPKFS